MITNVELRLRRAFEGWTQVKLAEELGITQEHLSRVEAGKEPISKKLKNRYIKRFGKKSIIDKLNDSDLLTTYDRRLRAILNRAGMRPEAINRLFFLAWEDIRNRTKGGNK